MWHLPRLAISEMLCIRSNLPLSIVATRIIILVFLGNDVACRHNEYKIDPEVRKQINEGKNRIVVAECDKKVSPNIGHTIQSILKMDSSESTDPKEKETTVDNILHELISSTIKSLAAPLKLLERNKVTHSVLWIPNWIVIHGADISLLRKLASLDVIISIRLDKTTEVPTKAPRSKPQPRATVQSDWNMQLIKARCSDITCNGTNVTIGIIDTGVQYEHVELRGKWVGEPYGWLEGAVPTMQPTPSDPNGGGTASAGIILGNSVGVAPGAKYMACKACDVDGKCSNAALLDCAQWILCPWKWNDASPDRVTRDCTRRPKIVFFGSGFLGGDQLLDESLFWFYDTLKLWNARGILSAFPMGDRGPNCNSGNIPATFDNAIAVGAVDSSATVWDESSRGPTIISRLITDNSTASGTCPAFSPAGRICTGTNNGDKICTIIKPDFVAPGYMVNSAWNTNNNAFELTSATGRAAAHVIGVMALMVCSNPKVIWNYKTVYNVLVKSSNRAIIDVVGNRKTEMEFAASSHFLCDVVILKICNGFPNNLYGNGLVNACAAVKTTKLLCLEAEEKKGCKQIL